MRNTSALGRSSASRPFDRHCGCSAATVSTISSSSSSSLSLSLVSTLLSDVDVVAPRAFNARPSSNERRPYRHALSSIPSTTATPDISASPVISYTSAISAGSAMLLHISEHRLDLKRANSQTRKRANAQTRKRANAQTCRRADAQTRLTTTLRAPPLGDGHTHTHVPPPGPIVAREPGSGEPTKARTHAVGNAEPRWIARPGGRQRQPLTPRCFFFLLLLFFFVFFFFFL